MPAALAPVPSPKLAGPVNVNILPVPYRSALVDTRMKPVNSMITRIPGSSFIVDYFSQFLGSSDQLNAFDPNMNVVLQQYLRIKNYELKLQGSLDTAIDPQTQVATITGTAFTYPYLTPNVGDCFIADIGDGRAGLFTVTTSVPKNILNETCHEITFTTKTFMNAAIQKNLDDKVVKDCEFVRDFITYGQNPVILSSEVTQIKEIESTAESLLNTWFAQFYSTDRATMLVGGMGVTTYDPYVMKMLYMILDANEHPFMLKMKELNVDDRETMARSSIWDILINRDMSMFPLIFKQATAMGVQFWNSFYLFKSIYYSRIERCVFPTGIGSNIDDQYSGDLGNNSGAVLMNAAPNTWVPPAGASIPLKGADTFYVFSADFYNQTEILSEFEAMVRTYLKREYVLPDVLLKYCKIVQTMPPLEQFYYIPVLVILLKAKIREW